MITYDEFLRETDGKQRTLLIGNGFSRACPVGVDFAFGSLLERAGFRDDGQIKSLFNHLSTVDFEEVLHSLHAAAATSRIYDEADFAEQLDEEANLVRKGLLTAIRAVHPERGDDIPRVSLERTGALFAQFESIFSLNYDLLTYWVLLEDGVRNRLGDGFRLRHGRLIFAEPDETHVWFLHGALHLFETPDGELLKVRRSSEPEGTIISAIENMIEEQAKVPFYIAEGRSERKREKIASNYYTRCAYRALERRGGVLLVMGSKLGPTDQHVVDAVNESPISSVYVALYEPERNRRQRELEFRQKFEPEGIEVGFVDGGTVPIW